MNIIGAQKPPLGLAYIHSHIMYIMVFQKREQEKKE